MSPAELAKRAKLKTWFRQGPKASLLELPYPKDGKGHKLPHGAHIHESILIGIQKIDIFTIFHIAATIV